MKTKSHFQIQIQERHQRGGFLQGGHAIPEQGPGVDEQGVPHAERRVRQAAAVRRQRDSGDCVSFYLMRGSCNLGNRSTLGNL